MRSARYMTSGSDKNRLLSSRCSVRVAVGVTGGGKARSQVTDGLGIAPDDAGGIGLPDEPWLQLEASQSLAEIAALVMDAAVPGFADAAGVFVLEALLENGRVAVSADGGGLLARRLGTKFAGLPKEPKTLPPGEVLAFAASSPYALCVREGRPVVFGKPDSQTLDQARPSGREVLGRYASFLVIPMTAHGAINGFVVFSREVAAAFTEPDTMTAARLTTRAGTGVDAALALMREKTVTRALQRGLLTAAPVAPTGLETAGRCLPAEGHAVGGDWYDVVPLSSGAGLTVGDVMGHGPAAAALMAQLRAAGHALAGLGLQPGQLLRRLSDTAGTLRNLTLATCVHAVIDPGLRRCVISAAGHLPPVLVLPDGTTHVPGLPSGPSFGLQPDARYGEARLRLPTGAVLALYTDGLAETRTRPFDQGIAALQAVLAKHRREPLEVIADLVVESLAARREDDVTILLARIPASGLRSARCHEGTGHKLSAADFGRLLLPWGCSRIRSTRPD